MSDRLRIAIVGCGDIARFSTLFFHLNRRIQPVACCDISADRVRQFARRYRIHSAYQDYIKMLAEVELDAVYLSVPHHLHYEMLRTAIQAGVAVLVEKPITRTFAEGVEIDHIAKAHGIKVGVNYQYRYDRGCYGLARAVQSGALGKILYARCNTPWHREKPYFDRASWHATISEAGGGTLITQGSHVLDVALWALGGKPRTASGQISKKVFTDVEVEDLALATIKMGNGAFVQLCSSMVATPEQAMALEVYGEKGTAIYTDKQFPRVRFRGVHVNVEKPPVWGLHALQRSIEGFRRWVMEDKPYLIPAQEALPVLAAVEAIYRSAETGQQESVGYR